MSSENHSHESYSHIATTLIQWYEQNKRNLPWRNTFLPYHIWISEMMLQQTQMTRGVEYFERWIARFPSVEHVAEASIEELYKYWEGLGYYTRVRNIHITAKRIVEEYNGIIPDDVVLLENLQGIGPYTARAIASIAYNHNVPVVDANVIRIITRIFGIKEIASLQNTKNMIYDITNALLPIGNARTFNQAMMEFGAMICNKQSKCTSCPFSSICYAYLHDCVEELPAQAPKKELNIYSTMAVILIHNNTILMRKRPSKGVWANLWEFPEYIFTPKQQTIQKQYKLFAKEKDVPIEAEQISIPYPADVAHAFYDEYGISLTVSQLYMTTKYSFTTNRVTLYAFQATCTEIVDILQSKYLPQQEIAFFTKEQLQGHTLSSGHNAIRNSLLPNIL